MSLTVIEEELLPKKVKKCSNFSIFKSMSCLVKRNSNNNKYSSEGVQRCSIKQSLSEKLCSIHKKTPVLESLFNKVASLKAWNFIKKRLQQRYFPVNVAKLLRTSILKNMFEWLLPSISSILQYNSSGNCYVIWHDNLLTFSLLILRYLIVGIHPKIIISWSKELTQKSSLMLSHIIS